MKLFHFDCYAVVSIDVDRDESGEVCEDQLFPEVEGYFLSHNAADEFVRYTDTARVCKARAEHECSIWHTAGCRWKCEFTPSEVFYAIVPLVQVKANCMEDLESSLKDAAKLQMIGVGKEVA